MRNIYRECIRERTEPQTELVSSARFMLIILSILAAVVVLFTFVYGGVRVEGSSMLNTLRDGDYLFVNRLASPERGDIIVVRRDGDGGAEFVIKRTIALEGDAIYAVDGVLFRRDAGEETFAAVKEDYLPEPWVDRGANMPATFASEEQPLVIGEGEIFYMGDNRNDSYDCRAYGAQPADHVWGTVTDWSLAAKPFFTKCFQFLAPGAAC